MPSKVFVLIAALTVVGLAGCMEVREPLASPDFANVGTAQESADFTLRVKVAGVSNGTVPIAGAFVGAAAGSNALAKTLTDDQGEAVLLLRKDQAIKLVAQADGWTREDSGQISIGAPKDKRSVEADCALTVFGPYCVVDDSAEGDSYVLAGDSGSVSLLLFRENVEQAWTQALDPHLNAYVAQVPEDPQWFSQTQPVESDPDFHRLYMDRLVKVQGAMDWTNGMQNQADLELGLGCDASYPATRTDNGYSTYMLEQGTVKVQLDWDSPQTDSGYWSACEDVYAGPIVDTADSWAKAHVKLTLTFEGKSAIVPINP